MEGLFLRDLSVCNKRAELSQAFFRAVCILRHIIELPDHCTGQKGGLQSALVRLGHCTRSQRNPSRFDGSLHTISLFTVHTATVAGPNLCPDEGSVCSVYSLVSWFKPPECCTWNWMSGESSPARLW